MKFEIPLFTGLLLVGASLLTRVQIQGVEAALLSTAVEYGLAGMRAGAKLLRATSRWAN